MGGGARRVPVGVALPALSQLEGALLLARTRRSLAPMVEAETVLRGMVSSVLPRGAR